MKKGRQGIRINPATKLNICRDPEDNFVLELAQAEQADYIVTRDKDLLDMKKWKKTLIVKPENFLPVLRNMGIINS